MPLVKNRRVRIRDDGSGNKREVDGTFAEFAHAEAIVLLGDPGIGKSTLLTEFGGSDCATVRQFLFEPKLPAGSALFLDGLDEYRRLRGAVAAPDDLVAKLIELGRPRFCLSCRAGDWFGEIDQEAIRLASPSRRVVVLELMPLSEDEITQLASEQLPDAKTFLDEAVSFGLAKLLGNPQTLDLFIRAWRSGRRPRNKFEAYQYGIEDLIRETNRFHSGRGASAIPAATLWSAAGAISSIGLLGHAVGVTRRQDESSDEYFAASVVPFDIPSAVDETLGRRVFTSPSTDCFQPCHRTIAEFLAGSDLAKRVAAGLPTSRVLALMCGLDGAPIAALRGLFAWFMCHLSARAEPYVGLDPYAVATYGDASVLPPAVQLAMWNALGRLRDPWFLTNEDDRGTFNGLANRDTAPRLKQLLVDPQTAVHLKIAALEALATASSDLGLAAELESIVLAPLDNSWLRSTALKALAKAKGDDVTYFETLDGRLSSSKPDPAAAELRATLLTVLPPSRDIPSRILSILDQASDPAIGKRAMGYLLPLLRVPTEAQLDALIDGAQTLISRKGPRKYEIRHLFSDWFIRRLIDPRPVYASQLARWLTSISVERSSSNDRLVAAIKARFELEPRLFGLVYDALYSEQMFASERDQWLFIVHDVWEALPPALWPDAQAEFFLQKARHEPDAEHAANFFRMFLSHLPSSGVDLELTDSAFSLVDSRSDLAAALGDWTVCKLEDWRLKRWQEQVERAEAMAKSRAENIAQLTPHLHEIRAGSHGSIGWGAQIYLGYCDDASAAAPRDRLLSVLDEPLTDAYIDGFGAYLRNGSVPTADAIIERWARNSIPYSHLLVSLAIYCTMRSTGDVPETAHASCVAAAITELHRGDLVPGYDATIEEWLASQAQTNPECVQPILVQAWKAAVDQKRGYLPGLQDLEKVPGAASMLAEVAMHVLSSGIRDQHGTVEQLVTLLLRHNPNAIPALAGEALAGNSASPEVVGIWTAALLLTAGPNDTSVLSTLSTAAEETLWATIEVLKSGRFNHPEAPALSTAKRAEVVALFGARFPNAGHPLGETTYGHQNPWDAAEFIGNQIKAIAGDSSAEADAHLARLEGDTALTSYRDAIRHHRAQREKQVRENTFVPADAAGVALAVENAAPANSADLLAYVEEHLRLLDAEMKTTSYERHQAYWNKKDRTFVSVKREEDCSGLLAHDLQARIGPHGLIATVEHHMVNDKECDVAVLNGTSHLLPIEVKHHYHAELWTAWRTQLDRLYTRDPKTGGFGVYCVLWSGRAHGRDTPKPPDGIARPTSAVELHNALVTLLPPNDQARLKVVVLDISPAL